MTRRPTSRVPARPPQADGLDLRSLCKKYGIVFKKALGQNLLLDDNINRIMVAAASLTPEDMVVEVGAGLGALTRRLCKHAGQLLSIEIDSSFMPCLRDQFGEMPNVHLFRGDVLNHELADLVAEHIPGGESYKMVSNLPYYITTPLLFHFMESEVFFSRLVVMMQEEVGQRLVAAPGTSDYGVLTLTSRCYADVDIVHRVSASCFVPRPKVDSCIVRFRCRKEAPVPGLDRPMFTQVVRAAFEQRRKTLRNSLTSSARLELDRDAVLDALATSGIDSGRRPETLCFEEFATLSALIKEAQASQQ